MKEKKNLIDWAMRYHKIVVFIVTVLIAFGIYSLPHLRKNEFPDFTIRQGIVVAAAPGLTAEEMRTQVARSLEDYIFTYKEVKKEKTKSICRDGLVFIQVELNDDLQNKDEFWSKFKHGVSLFKSQLPKNVLAVLVNDDFGDTSAILISMESEQKTYRELRDYMRSLQLRLRQIPSVGRLSVSGEQTEQISITIDPERLSHYALSERLIALRLMQEGFQTTGGTVRTPDGNLPVYVAKSLNTVSDIQQQIVWSDPRGNVVRLKDVATVRKEYPRSDKQITNNGRKCLLLSVEMKSGNNIVAMGDEVNAVIEDFQKTLPADVSIYRITDQPKVVGDSVNNFIRELLIAIIAVVIVVVLLLPIKVALVAASTIPITIFISLGIFSFAGLELNTVTLAALIMTLGMIVDNSIVIIDSYLEEINEGKERWQAAVHSAKHFFKSILSATLCISVTFFPFLFTTHGMIHDFLLAFPWAVTLILFVSLAIAVMLVPFMQYIFVKPQKESGGGVVGAVQAFYERLVALCFRWPKVTVALGVAAIAGGLVLIAFHPQQMMPSADRNQFAVEIYMPVGTSIEKTSAVADSLEHLLASDPRIKSIASFKGASSPRFMNAYAPQMPGTNYAQFIVNTADPKSTVETLDELSDKYGARFPNARIRFKQLTYSEAAYPVEFRLSGDDISALKHDAAAIMAKLREMPELRGVHTDFREPQSAISVSVNEASASRIGVSCFDIESALAMRYGSGIPLAQAWEGDYGINIVLKSTHSDSASVADLRDELLGVQGGLASVPLRQVADVEPVWHDGQIVTRCGVPTITIEADVARGINPQGGEQRAWDEIRQMPLSPGVTLSLGGEIEKGDDMLRQILPGLGLAVCIMFLVLIFHFADIRRAALIMAALLLCFLGAVLGLKIHGVDFGLTCFMGLIALMGIIVRNGIIMFDYASELRNKSGLAVREAIQNSACRRMRPIFLTSAAASMGVIPMILGGSGLWMPMGIVICYGTLITMLFLLTVLPVTYSVIFREKPQNISENNE